MNVINRQKFLAELGKLLSFMSDEDRKLAIEMYNELFDEAYSEQALIQYLISPTRQAVLVARAYNLVGTAPEKAPAEGEEPEFAKLIVSLGNEYLNNVEVVPEQKDIFAEDQISLFDGSENEDLSVPAAPVIAEEPAAEAAPEEPETEPAEESVPEESENPAAPEAAEEPAAEQPESEPVSAPAEEQPAAEEEIPAEEPAPAEAPAEEDKAVDAFLEEYRSPVEEEPAPEEEPAQPAAEEEVPAEEPAPAAEEKPAPAKKAEPVRKEKKLNVFLLILYLIPAIPLDIIGTVLAVIPTVLCLACAAVFIFAGVYVVSAALAGFAVIADLFVVTGLAIILLALGLLFLWLFIWFIGAVIIGLTRGLISLGKKLCVREVRVNG